MGRQPGEEWSGEETGAEWSGEELQWQIRWTLSLGGPQNTELLFFVMLGIMWGDVCTQREISDSCKYPIQKNCIFVGLKGKGL